MESFALRRTLIALFLFGSAFGYLEAAVVSYLRLLHEPARQRFHPGRSMDELFPLLTLEQLRESGADQQRTLVAEIGREAATILMLGAVALAVARNSGQWAAALAIAFGAWDITFYAFLRVLLDWPASLLTWDILFLIPVPWAGPVLAPVLVSAAMIGAGVWHLREPAPIGAGPWVGIVAGAVVIIVSFTLDHANLMAGGMPNPFHWTVFWVGMALGVGSYVWARSVGAEGAHRVERSRATGGREGSAEGD